MIPKPQSLSNQIENVLSKIGQLIVQPEMGYCDGVKPENFDGIKFTGLLDIIHHSKHLMKISYGFEAAPTWNGGAYGGINVYEPFKDIILKAGAKNLNEANSEKIAFHEDQFTADLPVNNKTLKSLKSSLAGLEIIYKNNKDGFTSKADQAVICFER